MKPEGSREPWGLAAASDPSISAARTPVLSRLGPPSTRQRAKRPLGASVGPLAASAALWLFVVSACGGQASDAPPESRQAAIPHTVKAAEPHRQVAVTFDDLPGIVRGGLPELEAVTARLLGHLREHDVPATGFVNEAQLEAPGEKSERTALLERWLDAGHQLGNHTYSHHSLYETPLGEFQRDVLLGERVTRELVADRDERLRYFRHPYLNTGPDLETKRAFEQFLEEHGYTVAPVTIDNDEWIYAAAYRSAAARNDSTLMRRIGEDYVRYMEEVFAFYERLSRDLLGRKPPQILLLHANRLNADYFVELAEMMRDRGYEFITLAEALRDPAYDLPDDYTGREGRSWLQRWAITQGRDPGEQPDAPQWIEEVRRN